MTTHSARKKLGDLFPRTARGFTLIEVAVVVVLLGLMSAMLLPVFGDIRTAQAEREAIGRVALVATAKSVFVRETGAAAFTQWSDAGGDSDRFLLLRDYLGPSASGSTLEAYFGTEFTAVLGDLGAKVRLFRQPGGNEVTIN